jgi:hypothetical protein
MALSADQQAMLQLLLERGQSYEDIASVLGVGVDEVRSRARATLAELAGRDPDAQVGLTDYLLGQADPIGRADAVRHLQSDPDSRALAAELVERLREIAPDAQLPRLPEPRERRRLRRRRVSPEATSDVATPAATREVPRGVRSTLSARQQQVIVGLAASAVLVIAAVLAITGAFGGGEDSGSATTQTAATTAAEEGEVLASVPLEPQGGGDATGEATFGVASGDQPYVQLDLSGLSPASEGQAYVLWLLLTEKQGYPLSPLQPGTDGGFSDRFPVPAIAIPIASRAREVDISLSENRSLLQNLERAVQGEEPILGYEGKSVLRGEIPASAQAGAAGEGRGSGQGPAEGGGSGG